MWKELHQDHRLECVMLGVAAIDGSRAYEFGSRHPIMAFLHAVMAVALVLAVMFCWHLGKS